MSDAPQEPGSLFRGLTITLPNKYEDMSRLEMTLAVLRMGNCEEWFHRTERGRREGEERLIIVTRYDIPNDTKVSISVPYYRNYHVDFEAVKKQLRDVAANQNPFGGKEIPTFQEA